MVGNFDEYKWLSLTERERVIVRTMNETIKTQCAFIDALLRDAQKAESEKRGIGNTLKAYQARNGIESKEVHV